MSIMHNSCSDFAPSIDSAKYQTEQLLSWLAVFGPMVYASNYKCFNDYLLQNVDIYKGSLILPYGDLISNYFDWMVKRHPDDSPTR